MRALPALRALPVVPSCSSYLLLLSHQIPDAIRYFTCRVLRCRPVACVAIHEGTLRSAKLSREGGSGLGARAGPPTPHFTLYSHPARAASGTAMAYATKCLPLDPSYSCRLCCSTAFDEDETTVTVCPSGRGELAWVTRTLCENCWMVAMEAYRHERLPGQRFDESKVDHPALIKALQEPGDNLAFLDRKAEINSTIREARSIWPHNMACVASMKHMACVATWSVLRARGDVACVLRCPSWRPATPSA